MINAGLQGTSVTVVLIGSQTANRQWINYEIEESHKRGNGILGIYIHGIACATTQRTDSKSANPFDFLYVEQPNQSSQYSYMASPKVPMSKLYPTYDWVLDEGYNNFQTWVEAAARKAGK
jgi:hypothetical protein